MNKASLLLTKLRNAFVAWNKVLKAKLKITFQLKKYLPLGFTTWHRRPKKASDMPIREISRDYSWLGIVVQGPYIRKNNFTLETLKFYSRNYRGSKIVYSSTQVIPKKTQITLDSLGIEVLRNTAPNVAGPGNLNFQIRSTAPGVKFLAEQGVHKVLKTRSDQRLYSPEAVELLEAIMNIFPTEKLLGNLGRIVLTTENTFVDRPFSGSDFLQYGFANDMATFWSIDEVTELTQFAPEQVIVSNYVRKLSNIDTDLSSIESWRDARRRVFAFVDMAQLDMLWYKYSQREYFWRDYKKNIYTQLAISNWIEDATKFMHALKGVNPAR